MAEILIKNMEMPRGNNVLVVDSAGTITKVNRWTGKAEATDPLSVKAVALPEHGRLLDADEIVRLAEQQSLIHFSAMSAVRQVRTFMEATNGSVN